MGAVVDISLNGDIPILNKDIECFVQQMCILFDTSEGEVMGFDSFGSDFERFTWDLSVSNTQISAYIRNIINNNIYIANLFDIDIDTSILYGTYGDIILVTIGIIHKETGDAYSSTYKIS